jgi:predicted acylesterase/phospholipase RssA/ABC-type phosphate/phosphonate transport system substrate-binding protein
MDSAGLFGYTGAAMIRFLLALGALALARPVRADLPEIRVALVSYGETPAREVRQLEPLAKRLEAATRGKARLLFAFGSYADVVSWVDQEKVDAAIVTPGVLGYLVDRARRTGRQEWRYLGSETVAGGNRAVCVTPRDSALKTVADVKAAQGAGGVEFLFVDLLSVSGRILPQLALKRAGVGIPAEDILYTSAHGTSLQKLLAERSEKPRVACVWEKVLAAPANAGRYRALDLPELRAAKVPPDALLAVGASPAEKLLEQAARGMGGAMTANAAWKDEASDVWRSFEEVEEVGQQRLLTRVSLDGIASMLVAHKRIYGGAPRLAVVFSGGGAKCSYQVGAVRAISERLARLRREFGDPGYDIGLVVGTSGGAINAVAEALGAADTPEGFEEFSKVWMGLDQRKIIRPSLAVRANMGFWFAACQDLLLLGLALLLARGKRQSTEWWGRRLLALGALQLLLTALHLRPWWFFGDDAMAQHLFLWAGWGVAGAGWIQCACGVVLILMHKQGRITRLREELIATVLLAAAVALPVLQGLRILWVEPTLSLNVGILELVAEKFPILMHSTSAPDADGDLDAYMRTLSREVFERGLLKRDLVLTGSRLAQENATVPPDLYFYAPSSPASPLPRFGERGVALKERPELLFDAMMGSGAIYPVFPARTIADFPAPGRSVDIVDGSFSHRSPVEAAVLWGATHIIVLEASPEEISPRGSFAENVGAALTHLYDQAQLMDQYSKQQTTTVTLYPSPPHIGLLDFSGRVLAKSIERGYRETLGRGALGWAPFHKEAGEPRFMRLGAP